MEDRQVLYRTEMSSDPERDIYSVLMFEITELHNTDILEYCRDNYNLPNILKNNISDYIEQITNGDVEEGDENINYMLHEIIGCIEDETGINARYVYWLTTEESVRDNYEGDEHTIYGYDVSNAVVLSDLGYDGVLYGFENEQEPCEEIEPDDDFDEDDELEEDDFEDIGLDESEIREIKETFSYKLYEIKPKYKSPKTVTKQMVLEARANHLS